MTPEQRTALGQRMEKIGRSVGIDFNFGGKIGCTRDAHCLIRFSQTKSSDVQNALVEKLFEAYHALEMDISNRNVLRKIAIDAGLDSSEVSKFLEFDENAGNVDAEAEKNREVASSGVPTFVIQGVHQVDGAQDPMDFMDIFVKLKEVEAP